MVAAWPQADLARQNPEIEARFAQFAAVLGALREIRSRRGLTPKTRIEFSVRCSAEATRLLQPMEPYFASMANAQSVAWGEEVKPAVTQAVAHLTGMDVFVDMRQLMDVPAEIDGKEKLEQKLLGQIRSKEGKLSNAGFAERAPADVVQRERESLAQLQEQLAAVQAALAELRRL